MLQIVRNPWTSPSVFGESIHTSPSTYDQAVPELLAPSASLQKLLSVQENDRKHDAVRNERRTHNEVRSALTDMISTTEALARNCLLYTSPSPRDGLLSRMPSSA